MLKRFFLFFFTTAFVLALSIPALADSQTYDIKELEFTIDIPDGFLVCTKDSFPDDATLEEYGIDRDFFMNIMDIDSMYLEAVSRGFSWDINVSAIETGNDDFREVREIYLPGFSSGVKEKCEEEGITVYEYTTYEHAQTKMVKLYTDLETIEGAYEVRYFTAYRSKIIIFTFNLLSGEVTPQQEAEIESIIDSVNFYNQAAEETLEDLPEIEIEEYPWYYIDEDTGLIFTVPAGWEQKELSEERKTIDAKFVNSRDVTCVFSYGSVDLWEEMDASEKKGITRYDIDNSFFSEEEIEEAFSGEGIEVDTVEIDGYSYYHYINQDLFPKTVLIRIENGWMYQFMYAGDNLDMYSGDVGSILSSIMYPLVKIPKLDPTQKPAPSNTPAPTQSSPDEVSSAIVEKGRPIFPILFAVAFVLALTIVIVVVVINQRKAKRIRQQLWKSVEESQKSDPPPSQENNQTKAIKRFCKNCGSKLVLGSDFCEICGTKLNDEPKAEPESPSEGPENTRIE